MPICVANGIRLYYERAGRGHPLVFIHGHTLTCAVWDQQWPVASAHCQAIRYDLRGHGRSEAPPSGYTHAHHGADLVALLDCLHATQATLVGLSFGGGVAIQLALSEPHRVASLVLVDSTLDGFAYSHQFRSFFRAFGAAIRRRGVQAATTEMWFSHPLFAQLRQQPDRFRAFCQMALQFSGAEYLDDTPQIRPQTRHVDRLGEVSVPTLVIVGEHDIADFQRTADALQRGIPGAEKVVIRNAGHVANLEQPDAFNAALLAFLRRMTDAR